MHEALLILLFLAFCGLAVYFGHRIDTEEVSNRD